MHTIVKTFIVLSICILIGFLTFQLIIKWHKKISCEKNYNTLPVLQLYDVNNLPISTDDLNFEQLMLIFFDPDCQHCLYEIRDLKTHIDEINLTKILLIATASAEEINSFILDNRLDSISKINVLRGDPDEIIGSFGNIPVPSIFIYDSNKKLVKSFRGEFKIETVINFLNYM